MSKITNIIQTAWLINNIPTLQQYIQNGIIEHYNLLAFALLEMQIPNMQQTARLITGRLCI